MQKNISLDDFTLKRVCSFMTKFKMLPILCVRAPKTALRLSISSVKNADIRCS